LFTISHERKNAEIQIRRNKCIGKELAMTKVYLYKNPHEDTSDHAWQHEMGRRLLAWAKEQPGTAGLHHHNISHSGCCVAVALSDVPVGVDVEVPRSIRERVAEKILSEHERAYLSQSGDDGMTFLQLWTLKESYGKALKVGIAYPMQQVELLPKPSSKGVVWQEVDCSDNAMSCFSMLKQDYVLSVCVSNPKAVPPDFFVVQDANWNGKCYRAFKSKKNL
jgi:phosphopantetheinyl transferase (holo-ACP synthase)